jgi:hypothetical protein
MVRKVKTFLHVFLRSLIPHTLYYSKILKAPFFFSFKYFIALLFALNLLFVGSFLVRYNPKKVYSVLSSFSTSLSSYPSDLVISVENGRLITNNNRPYLLWFDYQDKKNLLLVIDETATSRKIQLYRASLLLTSNELVIRDVRTNTLSALPINYLDDQKITKAKVNQVVQGINISLSYFPLLYTGFVGLLAVLLPAVSFLVTSLYLLFSSCIVYLVYKFFAKKHFRLKKIIQVSFHAATFPLLLDYLLIILQPTIRMGPNAFLPLRQIPFPLLFLMVLAFFIAVGIYEAHAEESHKKPHHPAQHKNHLHHPKKS